MEFERALLFLETYILQIPKIGLKVEIDMKFCFSSRCLCAQTEKQFGRKPC